MVLRPSTKAPASTRAEPQEEAAAETRLQARGASKGSEEVSARTSTSRTYSGRLQAEDGGAEDRGSRPSKRRF